MTPETAIVIIGLALLVFGASLASVLPWFNTCTNCARVTTKTDYCPSCNYSTLK